MNKNQDLSNLSIPETLDEPFSETLKRDFIKIWHKLLYVIVPRCSASKEVQLRNWDLWGPLIIILGYCILISFAKNATGNVFVILFFITVIGSVFVTLNGVLLGANLSYFQTICILGYCLFPIVFMGMIITIIRGSTGSIPKFVYLILASVGFIWASICKKFI